MQVERRWRTRVRAASLDARGFEAAIADPKARAAAIQLDFSVWLLRAFPADQRDDVIDKLLPLLGSQNRWRWWRLRRWRGAGAGERGAGWRYPTTQSIASVHAPNPGLLQFNNLGAPVKRRCFASRSPFEVLRECKSFPSNSLRVALSRRFWLWICNCSIRRPSSPARLPASASRSPGSLPSRVPR